MEGELGSAGFLLAAVAAFDLHFTRVEAYLQLLPTSNTTRIAVVLDDAALTFIGSGAAGNCSDAAAHPDYPTHDSPGVVLVP